MPLLSLDPTVHHIHAPHYVPPPGQCFTYYDTSYQYGCYHRSSSVLLEKRKSNYICFFFNIEIWLYHSCWEERYPAAAIVYVSSSIHSPSVCMACTYVLWRCHKLYINFNIMKKKMSRKRTHGRWVRGSGGRSNRCDYKMGPKTLYGRERPIGLVGRAHLVFHNGVGLFIDVTLISTCPFYNVWAFGA